MCLVAFQVVATAMQANARTFHAFSRDHGLPDRGLFAKLASNRVPIFGVWLVVFISGELSRLLASQGLSTDRPSFRHSPHGLLGFRLARRRCCHLLALRHRS